MNQNLILRIVGVILCIEALCMIPPLLLSVFDGGVDQRAFLYALLICGGVGVLLSLIRADNARLQTRDGFVCVALCWIALSVFGALPYFFSGSCSFIDAIFETVSGLTTTGASIFPSPASLPRGIQFWRALTQWMGGMGILVLMLALLPKLSEGSVNLMKAESPGPISTKLRPRTGETARILYRIYIALTVAEALLLRIAGLPLFDAITTALTTISTGGFSIRDASTLDAVSQTKLPILFLHGTADTFVPCSMSQAAYDACTSEKQLILVDGAKHGYSYLVDRPRVQAALADFLEKYTSKEAIQ